MSQMSQTKQKLTKAQIRENKLDALRLIFGTDAKVKRYENFANNLIKEGIGKRKDETDVQYMIRVQYCDMEKIPMCYLGLTYEVNGVVSKYVELKRILFKQIYPDYEIQVMASTNELCKIRGRATPESSWIPVEYTIQKAKDLGYAKNNKHWNYNTQKMLNKCCKGDFFDLAGGGYSTFHGMEASK
jgi:hypothetical protein